MMILNKIDRVIMALHRSALSILTFFFGLHCEVEFVIFPLYLYILNKNISIYAFHVIS